MIVGPDATYSNVSRDWLARRVQDADVVIEQLRAENDRLLAALTIARTALLNIERRSEEGRAAMTRMLDEQEARETGADNAASK